MCAVAAKKSDVSAMESVLPQHKHIYTDWQAWSKVLDEPAVPEQQPLRSGDSSSDAEDAADGAVTTDSIDSESQNTQERVGNWVQWRVERAQEEQQAGHSGRAYERQLQQRMAEDAAKTKRPESPSFDSDSQSQSQEESQPLF